MAHSFRLGCRPDRRGLLRAAGSLAAAAACLAVPAGRAAHAAAPAEPLAADASHAAILMYHRFGETRYPSTNVTVAQLEAHIALLRSGRYSVLPVPEILAAIRSGAPLPDRTVGITVDDGVRSFADIGWPRFRAAGLPVTLFPVAAAAARGGDGYLGWDDLRRLAGEGVTIGNQTLDHAHLPALPAAQAVRQIDAAQAALQAELGAAPSLFAYPYGEWSPAVRAAAVDAGFAAAFGEQSGVVWPGSDRFSLPRYPLNEKYGRLERFRLLCDSLPLPVTDLSPADPRVTDPNPPRLRFTVAPGVADPDRIACYVSGSDRPLALERIGPRRFEAGLPAAFRPGRTRVNCTLPVRDGDGVRRWRWLGLQFQVARPAA